MSNTQENKEKSKNEKDSSTSIMNKNNEKGSGSNPKGEGKEQQVYFSQQQQQHQQQDQQQQQFYQQQQQQQGFHGNSSGGGMNYGDDLMQNYTQGGLSDNFHSQQGNIIFNQQTQQRYQQNYQQNYFGGGNNSQQQQHHHHHHHQGGGGKKRFNKKKSRGGHRNHHHHHHNDHQSGGNSGGSFNVKNKRWSEKELGNLFSEYFEVISKFLDSKTKTHQLLIAPLKALVDQLDVCTKHKQPSKEAKNTFIQFRKVGEGICRVLISENDKDFKDELKHFGVLLKELNQLKVTSSKLSERELAKEFGKLKQSLDSISKVGNFGSQFRLPDPSNLGDTCSSILYDIVISIESLHSILGYKDKFWPKLGGESSSSSSKKTSNNKQSKNKKKKTKKYKKKGKVYKKNNDLSKQITLEFGKNDTKKYENNDFVFDENDLEDDDQKSNKSHHYKRSSKRQHGSGGSSDKKFGGKKKKFNNKKKGGDQKGKQNKKSFNNKNQSNNNNNKKDYDYKKKSTGKSKKSDEKQPQQHQQQKQQHQQHSTKSNYNNNSNSDIKEVKKTSNDDKFVTRQPFGSGYHYLINKKIWKNMDYDDKLGLVLKDRDMKADSQLWKFEHLGIGFFRIIHKSSGKALSRNDKDVIELADLNNKRNQNWILVKQFFGRKAYYLIFNSEKTKTLLIDLSTNAISLQFKNGPSDNDAWKIK